MKIQKTGVYVMAKQESKEYKSGRKLFTMFSLVIFTVLFVWVTIYLAPIIVENASKPEQFQSYVKSHGLKGRLIFVGIQILQVVFALIPGEFVEILAGYSFGTLEGLLLCLIGVAIASTLIFLTIKKAGNRLARVILSSEKLEKLKFLHNQKQLTILLFLLYFIPGTPKDIITYFAGLTKINLTKFLLISTIGRIPSILSSVYAGAELVDNHRISLIIFLISSVISVIGILFYRYISRKKETTNPSISKTDND